MFPEWSVRFKQQLSNQVKICIKHRLLHHKQTTTKPVVYSVTQLPKVFFFFSWNKVFVVIWLSPSCPILWFIHTYLNGRKSRDIHEMEKRIFARRLMHIFTLAFDMCEVKKLASALSKQFRYCVFKLSSWCSSKTRKGR